MANIYDKANDFEKELRQSDEYKALEAAFGTVDADEEAKKLYKEFVSTHTSLMQSAQQGVQPTEEQLKDFEELQKKLMENEKVNSLLQAQQRLQLTIEDLSRVMFKPLDDLFKKYEN